MGKSNMNTALSCPASLARSDNIKNGMAVEN